MAKSRIIIEYDTSELFDALAKLQPHGFQTLGSRIVEQMLMPETSFIDAVALSLYGVWKIEREKVEG